MRNFAVSLFSVLSVPSVVKAFSFADEEKAFNTESTRVRALLGARRKENTER
jgi:hypothetical protein